MRNAEAGQAAAELAPDEELVVALSPRECEALGWAMHGKTNWEISVILGVSERTVKFHLRNAMAKLHARTRAQAVAVALRHGLIGLALPDTA
jgi:DNA-binding CsgD family transcriptional regulator